MNVSFFYLAAAADCIVHAFGRYVRARTFALRPSSLWVAATVLFGTLCYWTYRASDNAAEPLDPTSDAELSLSTPRVPLTDLSTE